MSEREETRTEDDSAVCCLLLAGNGHADMPTRMTCRPYLGLHRRPCPISASTLSLSHIILQVHVLAVRPPLTSEAPNTDAIRCGRSVEHGRGSGHGRVTIMGPGWSRNESALSRQGSVYRMLSSPPSQLTPARLTLLLESLLDQMTHAQPPA
jgi:hypothetical protein